LKSGSLSLKLLLVFKGKITKRRKKKTNNDSKALEGDKLKPATLVTIKNNRGSKKIHQAYNFERKRI